MVYLEAIFPEEENLSVTYTLKEKDVVIKAGQLTAADYHKLLKNDVKTPKKFARKYVSLFKKNIEKQAMDLAKQLATEI
jgi:hypothetical protein